MGIDKRKLIKPIIYPIAKLLSKMNISPNSITIFCTIITFLASLSIIFLPNIISALFLLIAVSFDSVDGLVARISGKITKFGGFLDSTLDRLSEGFIFTSTAIYGIINNNDLIIVFSFSSMVFSYMISYAKARSECDNVPIKGGLMQRPERLLLFVVSLALGFLLQGLIILTILSIFTTFQRILIAYKGYKQN
ncbi:CDP-alcohol phosphatidyltransferase [Thermodesulfobium narugense DSM 14796]|uniref:CDP-alcohol phosphatidyltransferase n=1 Tax=Thermodesulfobium narugense DSM 14796 TaxID=747365 RepID=M1E5E3_9BACT|nr:CDP-alcohol phosphatidyltransferase family protein [Thermodesulfobium narugense]AEE14216.1 CDP-alcohol phosphatidyltransferase [Thermodesulfobium narugense DSM 14796]